MKTPSRRDWTFTLMLMLLIVFALAIALSDFMGRPNNGKNRLGLAPSLPARP